VNGNADIFKNIIGCYFTGKNNISRDANSFCFAIGNYDSIIRLCKKNESPVDVMVNFILPTTVCLFALSMIASLWLQHIGDDLELFRWVGILSHSVIRDLMIAKFHIQCLKFIKGKGRKQDENEFYKIDYDITNDLHLHEEEKDQILIKFIEKADPEVLNCQDRLTGFSCLDQAFCINSYELLFKMIEIGGYFKKTYIGERLTLSFPKHFHSKTFCTFEGSKIVILRKKKDTSPINWSIRWNGMHLGSSDGEHLIEVALNLRKF